MSPTGGGVGTARMIHGYVAKINMTPVMSIAVRSMWQSTQTKQQVVRIVHKGVISRSQIIRGFS